MEAQGKLRKWGNSLGVTVPKDLVDSLGFQENDEVTFSIKKKKGDLSSIRGLLKNWKKSSQQIKDEMREGWN